MKQLVWKSGLSSFLTPQEDNYLRVFLALPSDYMSLLLELNKVRDWGHVTTVAWVRQRRVRSTGIVLMWWHEIERTYLATIALTCKKVSLGNVSDSLQGMYMNKVIEHDSMISKTIFIRLFTHHDSTYMGTQPGYTGQMLRRWSNTLFNPIQWLVQPARRVRPGPKPLTLYGGFRESVFSYFFTNTIRSLP